MEAGSQQDRPAPVATSLKAGGPGRPRLRELLAEVSAGCSDCGVCVKECAFLQRHGSPQTIARAYDPADALRAELAYECNLCALCTSVCPTGVTPQSLFLEMRREAVDRGASLYKHRGLMRYESTGSSRWFSWYGLPSGCDTIFFPGCALPGTRPRVTLEIYRRLARQIPRLGIVLDCCGKPSHDLGRENHFASMFAEMKEYLVAHGIRRVLVACPNCWKVFTDRGPEFRVETVYEVLTPAPESSFNGGAAVTIHDPCVLRFAPGSQQAVRDLVTATGASVSEMRHHGKRALCCGEGGNAGAVAPDLAQKWRERRATEASGRPVVTSCAGCANHLAGSMSISHVLDYIIDPERAMAGKAPVSRGWLTYWNRLRLKFELKRAVPTGATRVRTFRPGQSA
jgi:Fe-S oxidoreductase